MFNLYDYVKINGTNIEGYIVSIQNEKITIMSNEKYVTTNIKNITKTEKKTQDNASNNKVNLVLESSPEYEIMLRHQTVDEAMQNLDKFIDNAVCNNIKIVKIIHGKRGGILRHEVKKYLENSPYVKEFRLGGYYEGSYGVTIAFLK